MAARKTYILKLYVAGNTPNSMRALNTLREILENEFKGVYALKVIDVLKQPQLAEEDKILATPTLAKILPPPVRRIIGDLSDREKVLLLKDKNSINIGKPYVKDAKIELEVVSHKRDKKILVYKMRPKKKTRRKMGHRQELTRVMVKSISLGKSAPKSSSKKETVKKETKPKSEKSTN